MPTKPNLLRTHPGSVSSLEAKSPMMLTFMSAPILIHAVQVGAFFKVEKLDHNDLLYRVSNFYFSVG